MIRVEGQGKCAAATKCNKIRGVSSTCYIKGVCRLAGKMFCSRVQRMTWLSPKGQCVRERAGWQGFELLGPLGCVGGLS